MSRSDLQSLVDEFRAMIAPAHDPSPKRLTRSVGELRDEGAAGHWEGWHKKRGVYYFCEGEEVVYVGVGSTEHTGTLGARVKHWIGIALGRWGEVVADPENTVGLLVFEDDRWFWALSLEAFLIERLKPELNERYK